MLTQLNIFVRLSILLLMAGLVSPALAANSSSDNAELPKGIVGAVCVIRHDNQMIMLSEVITKKNSLPGGYIEQGDTPEEAAAREVLEETGIVVKVVDLLQYRDRAAIYSCVSKSPILVSSFEDHTGHPIVASWFSKHFSVEVKRVYLAVPGEIALADYRYPDDAPLLQGWLEKAPNSEIEIYSDLSERLSSLQRMELGWIRHFQQSIKALPDTYQTAFDYFTYLVNLPGESVFIALLVAVVAGFYGPQALLQLAVLLLVAIFTAISLKLGVASPRPSDIMPELQQINAYGYGFPSLHTLLATILWGMCWHVLTQRISNFIKWLSLPFFLLFIAMMAFARVWYGVHFISDTLVSVLLGIIMVSMLIVWHTASRTSLQNCIASKWFWLLFTMMVGLTASFTFTPVFAYIFAFLLGIFVSVEMLPAANVSLSLVEKVLVSSTMFGGTLVINYGVEFLAGQSSVSLIVLAIRCIGFSFAALWLVGGSSLLSRKLSMKRSSRL
ncbi:phosphatase PAP2 family protein [uncultured Photobacterium sp.]|uniref:bifunctional NUDIX hydrolase/phosphatase PAP2 family protein n=1 Tax=uncultured Photobacterium sp. TaxID=173973 RepID=UPI002601F5F4|nr:phosphatase PAP2 family protein [uncultured Photobacterium sp.]